MGDRDSFLSNHWGKLLFAAIVVFTGLSILFTVRAHPDAGSKMDGYDVARTLDKWNVAPDIRTFDMRNTNVFSIDDTSSVFTKQDNEIAFNYNENQAPFYYNYKTNPQLRDARDKGYFQLRMLNCSYPDYSWI